MAGDAPTFPAVLGSPLTFRSYTRVPPCGRNDHAFMPGLFAPLPQRIVIPTGATLTTLADVRVLIEHLPDNHRDDPAWLAAAITHERNELERRAWCRNLIPLLR